MLATKEDITRYIPQRAPIVMIHDLVEADAERVVTRLHVEPDNIFVWGGRLEAPGLVENIAQTAAAQIGYYCAQNNIPVPLGYIAAVKDLQIDALPLQNSQITTSVRILHKVMDFTVARGEITQGDRVLCSCEMKILAKLETRL